MKKFLSFMAAAVVALLTVGCAEGYDDSALWSKIREMDSRLVNLEELCKEMNTNISSLQTIVEALQNNDYVTAIVPIKKEGEVIGYTISFAKSDSITLYINGGENQEGYVPQIGVKEDVDGQIYWTIDGEWLLDSEGNKVKAVGQDGKDGQDGQPGADGEDGQDGQPGADGEDGQDGQPGADGQDGQDGKDGVTPELKIENGMWYVSYDGGESWTELGKATGEDGKDGQNGQDGKPGADGEDGVGVIVDVTWDEENVYFTLYDGTVITLPFSGAATPEEPEEPEEPALPEGVTAIAEVLALGNGATIQSAEIEAVVISNMDLNNLTSKKGLYVQDATGGLQFYLAANHELKFGDKVRIDLSGAQIAEYNGAVQISGLALDKITTLSSGNAVEAKTVTMADFLANKYEGQYIAIEGVQVASADLAKSWVMNSSHTSIAIEDANGNSFAIFSSKYATFGTQTVAQGSGTIKGISSISKGAMQLIFAQESDFAGLTGARFGATVEPEEPEQPVDPTPTPGEGGYTKVTSVADLTDGEYLIVYDGNSPAYVFNGQDAVNGYEEATVQNNTISGTFAGVVMIETMEGGYSIKAPAGYLSGTKDSNKLNFGSTAALNTITFEADGTALITSNTSVLRFNSTSNQMRFRYYKATSYTGQQPVSLYKKN